MRTQELPRSGTWLKVGAAALAAAAVSGWAFSMWMQHGSGIFFAMAQSGLSWCF